MKRVKLFFGVLTLLAVAGSTMAFTARDIPVMTIWQKNSSGTACPAITLNDFQQTTQALAQIIFLSATLSQPVNVASCSLTIYIRAEE